MKVSKYRYDYILNNTGAHMNILYNEYGCFPTISKEYWNTLTKLEHVTHETDKFSITVDHYKVPCLYRVFTNNPQKFVDIRIESKIGDIQKHIDVEDPLNPYSEWSIERGTTILTHPITGDINNRIKQDCKLVYKKSAEVGLPHTHIDVYDCKDYAAVQTGDTSFLYYV